MQYWYDGDEAGDLPVDFSIVWDGDFFIDKPAAMKGTWTPSRIMSACTTVLFGFFVLTVFLMFVALLSVALQMRGPALQLRPVSQGAAGLRVRLVRRNQEMSPAATLPLARAELDAPRATQPALQPSAHRQGRESNPQPLLGLQKNSLQELENKLHCSKYLLLFKR